MKRNYIFLIFVVYCLMSTVFLWGCGSGPGSPGSTATEDTGVILDATLAPSYLGTNTYSVDVVKNPQPCVFGDPTAHPPTPDKFENFLDHNAILTVDATLVNPNPQITPGTLYIEKYTIEYRRSQDSIGAPPIESDTRYVTLVITPPLSGTASTTTTATLVLVDLTRKDKYLSDILTGAYAYTSSAFLNNYTATYTFEGQNQYGKRFSFIAQTNFQMGSFNYCPISKL